MYDDLQIHELKMWILNLQCFFFSVLIITFSITLTTCSITLSLFTYSITLNRACTRAVFPVRPEDQSQ